MNSLGFLYLYNELYNIQLGINEFVNKAYSRLLLSFSCYNFLILSKGIHALLPLES